MCVLAMVRAIDKKINLLKELSKSGATLKAYTSVVRQLAKEQDSRGDILKVHGLHKGRRFCAGLHAGLSTRAVSEITSFFAS